MSTVNRHTVFGRLGRDPQIQGEGDKSYAILAVATQEYVKGKGDKDKNGNVTDYKTTWHKAVAFSDQARYIADNFGKGDMIYLEGPLEIAIYTKKDNQGNVIDENAVGVRTIVKVVAGKGLKNANGNGNGNQKPANNGSVANRPAPQPQNARPASNGGRTATATATTTLPAPREDDDIPF